MRVNTRYTNSTRGTSSQSNGEKTKVTRLLEQDKSCPLFPPTPFNLATSQAHSLTVPKASAFSSTARCPWRTSSVKPQNPASTRSVELVLPGSSCPPRLLTVRPVTSLILSRLDYCSSLLSDRPASSVHRLRRIQNCGARLVLKNTYVKLTTAEGRIGPAVTERVYHRLHLLNGHRTTWRGPILKSQCRLAHLI